RVGGALLEERFVVSAIDEALERHWATANASDGPVGYRQIVVDQIKFGVARAREEDLSGVGDGDLAAFDLQNRVALGHAATLDGARGRRTDLLVEMPGDKQIRAIL